MCNDCRRASRRDFLAASAAGLAAAGLATWLPARPANAKVKPTALTPAESLEKLKTGNAKFVAAPELCVTDIGKRREEVAGGQAPWATILTCADSRVPPELLFGGLTLGKLFVCRNAGNTADIATLGSIEYAAEHLGSPLIVVLGHQKCGAVAAACEVARTGETLPGAMGEMVEPIVPSAILAMKQAGDVLDNAIRENARRTADKISVQSPVVSRLVGEGQVRVAYAIYSLDTGAVDFFDA